jgi:glycosyltransferase involved in cell wall biosynthesis
MKGAPNVLWIAHLFASYRLPVMIELAGQNSVHYEFLSGTTGYDYIRDIPTVDPQLAARPADQGGLNWRIVRNTWLGKSAVLWQAGVIRACRSARYDCIIFTGNPYFLSTWVGILIARLSRKKVLLWAHGTMRGGWLKGRLRLLFFGLADGLLLYGNWAREVLIRNGMPPGRLFVVHNALDYPRQLQLRAALDAATLERKRRSLFARSELPVLLFIGRLTPEKKLDTLIELCHSFSAQDMPVNFLVIGDGSEGQKLQALQKRLGLGERIRFYGECYAEDELAPLIALSDLCISPGNVGLTALHCLVYGTPVITHDNPFGQGPEFEAIVPGYNGAFFKQGSTDSMADTIAAWLRENQPRRDQIRRNCRESVDERYTPARVVAAINRAVLDVCGTG